MKNSWERLLKCRWRWEVTRINYNNTQRDSFFNESVDDVALWYEAFGEFVKLMHRDVVDFKLCDGQIQAFDNVRVLHGRTLYVDKAESSRCVVGVYVNWDQVFSEWRVLRSQQKSN